MGFDSLIFDRRRIGRRHTTILCKDINEIKFYQEKLHTYYPAGLPGQQPAVANCQRPQLCTACHINCQFVGHLGQAGIRTLPGWFLLSSQPTSSPVAPFVQLFFLDSFFFLQQFRGLTTEHRYLCAIWGQKCFIWHFTFLLVISHADKGLGSVKSWVACDQSVAFQTFWHSMYMPKILKESLFER